MTQYEEMAKELEIVKALKFIQTIDTRQKIIAEYEDRLKALRKERKSCEDFLKIWFTEMYEVSG